MINKKRHLQQFLDLVKISSESRHEKEVANYLLKTFKSMGLKPAFDKSQKKIGGNANNIVIKIPGALNQSVIMLNAHMDTVTPGIDVKPRVKNGWVTSDGTTVLGADDKAGVACIIEVLHILKENKIPHCPLLIVITCAEEIGLVGAKNLNLKVHADMGFVLDGQGNIGTIINQAPYQDTFEITIHGKAAHAGIEPEKGRNAIVAASKAISQLKTGRIDEETTVNIGIISGGTATNIVPAEVYIKGEARSSVEYKMEAEIFKLRQIFDDNCKALGVTYDFVLNREYDGYCLTTEDLPLEKALAVAHSLGLKHEVIKSGGGSDANIFNSRGIPCIVLGMGMEDVHTTHERIMIDNLYKAVDFLTGLVSI